jgi:D-alanyl-D-alanine carboxypeptidase/D-alanyl-D-alanine-endopeptidase (penicillin-binding protein 4)
MIKMYKKSIFFFLILIPQLTVCQEKSLIQFLADSAMEHALTSICFLDASSGQSILEFNADKSLTPASILKLVTSSAALELLGSGYTFKTQLDYSGTLNKRTGKLTGDLLIKGGGDPALGSDYFAEYYKDFPDNWITAVRDLGIRKIEGKVITDDSRYDYQPVPAKWLWEDAGNYYGAGAYGLSVFDNTYKIHFRTLNDGSIPEITSIIPAFCRYELSNQLLSAGSTDKGYVFAAPYSDSGWITGSIPVNREDFILKASITDPPLLLARIIDSKLDSAGIEVSEDPTTVRVSQKFAVKEPVIISEIVSPPLREIIEILNHESVNLYAEHVLKEIGKVFKNQGTASAGIEVLKQFLDSSGVGIGGLFMEDGSGLSPMDAVTSRTLTRLLFFMKTRGKTFHDFYSSLPDAGKEGTLKAHFHDPVIEGRIKAKSGSMTRVRSYAGYIKTLSGNDLIFCIIVNNFSGPSQKIISGIEGILKEAILYK